MKLKAFLFALVLLVGYYFITEFLKRSGNGIVADQGPLSQNSIKAQAFLYDFNLPKYNCIVGTSLSVRLQKDGLPSNYYNLCFHGQNVLDGLMVLKQKTNLPDTLFIETNFITGISNENFISKVAETKHKVLLKQKLCFLQEKYLPIGWTANYLKIKMIGISNFYRRGYKFIKNRMPSEKVNISSINSQSNNENQFNDVLKLQQKNMAIVYGSKKNPYFEKTKVILRELEKRSVKLVFFEMPIHCSLVESNSMTRCRNLIHASFNPNVYHYLNLGNCQEYETTDAVHLTPESAVKCTKAFRNNLGLR